MALKNLKFSTQIHLLPIVLVIIFTLNSPHVRGRNPETFKKEGLPPTEGTVEVIEGDDGDVVDCVDIYKQRAFNHPLLKDHKIQMDPSSSPSEMNGNNTAPDLMQPWHKYGMCSQGTVPIRRRQLQDKNSSTLNRGPHHEFAAVIAVPSTERRFYGGSGVISLWEPAVSRPKDFSASMLTVTLSEGVFISTGWIVFPELYGDSQTRLFVYWTTDDGVSTGCFDLLCDGFVQVNHKFALGGTFTSVSTLGADEQLVLKLSIALDRKTGNWWVLMRKEAIGYWPAALFTGVPEGAMSLEWGGQVYDSIGSGRHTDTDMGNGLFPDVGTNSKASFVCSLQYVDSTFTLRTPPRSTLGLNVTNPLCYDAELFPSLDPNLGLCFSYGGSGRNPRCP